MLIPKELVEPVSNFLLEQGATGIEEIEDTFDQVRVKTYFLQNGKEKEIFQALQRYLRSLRNLEPKASHIRVETTSISEQDWGENWKKFFKPLRVGSRFVVKPPWARIRLKQSEIPIEINPGMAFGTGTHATTQLCMEALEKRLNRRGFTVLDVGTGSGILSIAACRLGAAQVWGIDIDPVAVEIARENVDHNGVSKQVKILKARIGEIRKRFDLVVANIDFRGLRRARKAMLSHLKKHGFLILSGILDKEEERLHQYYVATGGLQWVETTQKGEWICFTLKKK
ncbi:MAG: 50S ribosomal protein L11 methyltransferase [Deltaproteobacteria bacterium]|nr:50S ribosomal protein L11 methyltransferase [Deltaproteobacteria bacterium]